MKEIARFVKKLRGLNHVLRWNFQPCIRNPRENVAEHSMWVAVFAGILADPKDRHALVFAALTHDFEEAITADLPALVKAQAHEWGEVVKKAESELFFAAAGPMEREIQDAFVAARHTAEASPIVKMADLFSALMYARMERELGNTHFERIERELIKSLCKLISRPETDADVAYRAKTLLDGLGFDSEAGVDRPEGMSHL